MGINEHTSMTLRLLTNVDKHGTILTNKRREDQYDHNGRNAYGQRRSPYAQIHRLLYQGIVQERGIESRQNWRTLENKARGFTELRREKILVERQKIKPAYQLAIEISAAGQFLTVWTTSRNAPRNSLLILIIQNLARIYKVCYEKAWACGR